MKQIKNILAGYLKSIIPLHFALVGVILSQPSVSNQIVTLEVLALNKIVVHDPLLRLEPETSERTYIGSIGAAETRLIWTSNGDWRKISVSSKHASRRCIVNIDLEDIDSDGSESHQVRLTDRSTKDVLSGISRSAGSCRVRLVVHTTDGEGGQPHVHTIVYTVTGS